MNIKKLVVLILTCCSLHVSAHEFWLESSPFTLNAGSTVAVDIKIGQLFNGRSYPLIEHEAVNFSYVDDSGITEIKGFTGDKPAYKHQLGNNEYRMVGYESSAFHIQFDETGKFVDYLNGEGLEWVLDWYRTNNIDLANATETYYRHAKTLSGGKDADEPDWLTKPMGHRLEIVPERGITSCKTHPSFQVLWDGRPAQGLLLRRFHKERRGTDDLRTDKNGRVRFSAAKGAFLINTVRIAVGDESPRGEGRDWYSDWASFTYECK